MIVIWAQIWMIFGASGEVLAENLTRCHSEIVRNADLWGFAVAFGEILGQNLTKCPENDVKIKPPFQRLFCNGVIYSYGIIVFGRV